MAELAPGEVVGGRFEIAGVLGRGGMATVYLAQDRVREQRVALKVVHPHLAGQVSGRARLRREIAAAQRIRHPRALVASELFELDGHLLLSMPLHPGQTLAEDVDTRGPLSADELWRLGESLAGALAEAHRVGVLHCDLAPGNVLLDRERQGTLTDFGLARLDDSHTRTATTALGTAGFTAPEVLDGGRPDARSDLYGLGCVLYLAATGKAPFEAGSPLAILKRQAEGAHEPLAQARSQLPVALRELIERLLSRDPADRPESARAVADAMARREGPAPRPEPPPRPQPSQQLPANPRLPSGTFTVELMVPHEHRVRRRHRRQLRRAQRVGLEGVIEGVVMNLEPAVRNWLGLPPGREPEELLREWVAAEAKLPADALVLSPALEESRFRLVNGVSMDVAMRLVQQAREIGYRARAQDGSRAGPAGPGKVLLLIALAVLAMLIGAAPILSGYYGIQAAIPVLAVLAATVLLVGGLGALSLVTGRRELPLAYDADLRPYLRAAYARPAPAPEPAPTPEPRRESPADALSRSTAERLAALERAIGQRAAQLPAEAIRDLKETLAELRERAQAAQLQLDAVQAELSRHDPRAEEQAATRVQARLERLRARVRAGEPVDPAEQAPLERSLAAHQERLDAIELDEQRIIRLQAALLEIGAAADTARRTLLAAPDPARSMDDLLPRLKAESAAAQAAEQEIADARRRAAAQQASRIKP